MTFDEFAKAVELEVNNADFVDAKTVNYKRGKLTVTLFEQSGNAFVSYSADPTRGGRVSGVSGLPYDLTPDGAKSAAVDIVDKLNDPHLYK